MAHVLIRDLLFALLGGGLTFAAVVAYLNLRDHITRRDIGKEDDYIDHGRNTEKF
jgi:hypothetical protein